MKKSILVLVGGIVVIVISIMIVARIRHQAPTPAPVKKPTVTEPVVPTGGPERVLMSSSEQAAAAANEAVIAAIMNKASATDQDFDHLSNDAEKTLGTDPTNPDTDGDGLLDGDEASLYHTNPLKVDTDGDGYSDGYEVSHGQNPLGPGLLNN